MATIAISPPCMVDAEGCRGDRDRREIWFGEPPRVYLSGSSGRYPPRHPSHLEDAERLFRSVGFEVLSLGWDQETDKPHRVWRGQER